MKLSKSFKVVFSLLSLLSMTGCKKSEDVLSKIVSTKTLTVGTEATYVPFEYTDTNGNIVGFDVDVVSLVEKKIEKDYNIELTVKWKDMSFDSLIGAIQTDKVDLVAAAMTIDDERSKSVLFSDGYYDTTTAVLVQDSATIESMDVLKTKKCGAQQGTVQADYIQEKGWNSSNMVVTSVADLTLALQAKQIDALVVESSVADAIITRTNGLKKLTTVDFEDQASYGIASKLETGSSLIKLVNEVIADAKKDGTLSFLYNDAAEAAKSAS